MIALFGVLWLLRMALWALNIKPLSWLWLVLLLAVAVVVVWQQIGTVIGREGGVAFLLLLTVLKAYEGRGLRDWQVLLLAMLVVMGGAVLFNQNVLMAVWLLLGLMLLSADMALLGGLKPSDAVRQSAQALALALPLAAVLFVAVPRVAEPLWRIPQHNPNQASTGLSDTMRPGSISDLVQSNEPAFNATFANGYTPLPQNLYWRVMVMADFDGSQWRAMDERYVDDARAVAAPAAPVVDYQLIIRDEEGRIPALDYPIHTDSNGLSMRLGAVVRVNRSREGLRRVALQATINPYLGQTLNEGERAYYTRLPAQANPQTRALARQLRLRSNDDKTLVNQALAYFRREGFVYTLQPLRNQGTDSTDYFLFQGREGFCEDYANAFVNLMRAADVPARIVTGYLGGEYNPQGQFWQVRSKDAHAWAEVWLASENAWLRVDPTTAVAEVRASGGVVSALPPGQRGAFMPQNSWLYGIGQSSQFYWQQWVPLDVLQFHGDETAAFCRQFARPYIKAVRVATAADIDAAARDFADARALLLDAAVPGQYGGTGQRFDWCVLPAQMPMPWLLAGGLDANNVAQAIAQSGAVAVDVSGGVESAPGIKDVAKMAAFIRQARGG